MTGLKYKIFVYGTLKRNEPNNEELTKRNAFFLSKAVTLHKWPLVIASNCNLPFLLNKKNHGKNVVGEVYIIDQETKEFLDYFEGVEDGLYTLHPIEVLDENKSIHVCQTYFLDNFNQNLLSSTIYFDNYSSVNSFYGEYKKSEDTPENIINLLKEIKDIKTYIDI